MKKLAETNKKTYYTCIASAKRIVANVICFIAPSTAEVLFVDTVKSVHFFYLI